uniref:HEAT repeat domain-containing protein n=1 Tax=Heterorhabditis bacteriophora TaxID=37862 RepID=A0A1I7XJ22_HETBA
MRRFVICFVPILVLCQNEPTGTSYFEISDSGLYIHYEHSINATVDSILTSVGVAPDSDVSELVPLKSQNGYKKVAILRLYGLHQKINILGKKLAAIYGFHGEEAMSYAMLIRPMSLKIILATALDGAQKESDSVQYKAIKALANKIGMGGRNYTNGYINRNMAQ